jgi:hypothetical protein
VLRIPCRAITSAYFRPNGAAGEEGGALPRSLEAYMTSRVLPTMDVESLLWGDPAAALFSLGFSVFHGGVCHSVVQREAPEMYERLKGGGRC